MLADYHTHTSLCKHASGTPAEFLQAAVAAGLDEICFTDHAPAPGGYDAKHRMTMEQFPTYRTMVAGLQAPGISVRFGIEADYYPGCEDFLRPWLARQNFDLVIGSIHYIRDWGFDNPDERSLWDSVDVTATWREYFELLRCLAETRLYDVVGHMDIPKKFGYRPPDRELTAIAGPALDAIARAGMSIEINTSGIRRPVREMYPSQFLLRMARERNIPLCLGSDAHAPDEVGYAFADAVQWARQAGYSSLARYAGRRRSLQPIA